MTASSPPPGPVRAAAGWLARPIAIGAGGTMAVGLAVILAAWAFMVWDWERGRTIAFSVAGILPISDAAGYYGCANGLIDLGHFADDYAGWCDHRPIYLGMLASLLVLGGRYLQIALLMQAALVAACVAVATREALRLAGVLGAAAAMAVLWAFAAKTCFLTTATESAGLALGALALAVLLRAAERSSRALALGGIALLSIALNARAGALLVLPLLVPWSGLLARQKGYGVWHTMSGALAAVAIGFMAEYLLVVISGSSAGAAHGSFAYTLYGLAVGGKTWVQLALDHPEIAGLPTDAARSQAVYHAAFDAIRNHPFAIVGALVRNFGNNLVDTATFGIGTRFGQSARWAPLAVVAAVPWLAGVASVLVRLRDPRHMLLGAIVLGNLLSGAIIVQDGGVRVFAATIGGDALVAGLGIAAILRRLAGDRPQAGGMIAAAFPASALGLAALLLALVIAPFTPLRRAMAMAPLIESSAAGLGCGAGESSLLVRLGRESVMLASIADGGVGLDPPRVPATLLHRELDPAFWFAAPFQYPPPISYVLAYQRAAGAPDRGTARNLVWFGDLSPLAGRPVRLCATSAGALSVDGLSYDIVTSVTPLEVTAGQAP